MNNLTSRYLQRQFYLKRYSVRTLAHRMLRRARHPDWPWWWESLQQAMSAGLPAQSNMEADEIRTRIEAVPFFVPPVRMPAHDITIDHLSAEWLGAELPEARRVILYLHGGGYIAGSCHSHRPLTTKLAEVTGTSVCVLEYRLAPEFPYPSALVDAWYAFLWLLRQGIPAHHIIVAGDSAGGGLAIALMIALREAHVPLPAAAICLSPWLDLAMQGETVQANLTSDYLNQQVLEAAARMYLGTVPPQTPTASPLYADLHGLSPILIQAGKAEMLLDDSRRFAARARAAGVDVTLEEWDQMIHVWHFFYRLHPAARDALEHIRLFVEKHLPEESRDCQGSLDEVP